MLSEISQIQTNALCYHLCVKSKEQTNVLTLAAHILKQTPNKWMYVAKQKQTHRYRELVSGYQWRGRGKTEVGDWEVQTTMYKIEKQQRYKA